MIDDLFMKREAEISDCGLYRYALRREWDTRRPPVCFGMLNPSTADAMSDDPTIRRCLSRAAALGFGSLTVWNLFALRATDPRKLKKASDPIGPANDQWIAKELETCVAKKGTVIVAWGINGAHLDRNIAVAAIAKSMRIDLYCLGLTTSGHPRHPLYVSSDQRLVPFTY
jgi:hypothetical protein